MTEKPRSSQSIMYLVIVIAVVATALVVWLTMLGKDNAPPVVDATSDAEARIAPVARIKLAAPEPVSTGPKSAEAVYKSICMACHGTGVAGAPKAGNKDDWAPRIAQGIEALDNSALHGKKAMPPKGGATGLSDDEIKSAVQYMVDMAK